MKIPVTTRVAGSAKRPDPSDSAFAIRVGKDVAGTQYLEIRSGERTAMIVASDILLPSKQLADKLLAQRMPVLTRPKIDELQRSAQNAVETMEPSFTLVSTTGWIGDTAFVHGKKLIGFLPEGRVFRP